MSAAAAATPAGAPQARRRGSYLRLLRFGADPLAYATKLGHGNELGVVPFRIGNTTLHLVTEPGLIERMLELDGPPELGRGRFSRVGAWYREGIFVVTDGPEHDRQRDVIGRPIWDDPRTVELATAGAEALAAGWREGEPVDVWAAFRRLHYETDWQQLTGERADEAVLAALMTGDAWQPRLIQPFGTLLWRLPTGRSGRRASALLDARIDALVEERRRRPDEPWQDQLARLVRLAAEDGVTTDEQLRATVKMQFPDPLHNFVTWVFWALGRNPEVEERWLDELDRELGGRPATAADLERLPYAHRVLMETMRLYSPSFAIFREALRDLDLGGNPVSAGDIVVASQWVTHRDPRLWDDPLRFDPDRWADGAARPRDLAYFPFSAGPHGCHGRVQALREVGVVAATISARWRLRPVSEEEPRFALGVGLEPKGPLRMLPVRR
jgi:cytochrome P450